MCLSWNLASAITTCTIFAAFLSVVFQAYLDSQQLSKVTTIVSSLVSLEHNLVANRRVELARVVVGFGISASVHVNVAEFLKDAPKDWEQQPDDGGTEEVTRFMIGGEEDFRKCLARFMRGEESGRRFISNATYFHKLLEAMTIEPRQWTLGGNPQTMAKRFSLDGAKVMLAARLREETRKTIYPAISVVGNRTDSDEVHIIVEYRAKDYWAPLNDPRIMRLILHRDKDSPMLGALEDLSLGIEPFNPNLFVISGLQAMDHYPFDAGVRERRLIELRNLITSRGLSTRIHLELAHYEELIFFKQLLQHTIPYVDSIGLNDQELDRFDVFLQQNRIVSPKQPTRQRKTRVAIILDQMRSVFRQLRQRDARNIVSDPHSRSITRLHVHTKAFQAILVGHNSQWLNTKNAAAKAALQAYRTVCEASIANPESAKLIMDGSFASTAVPGATPAQRWTLNELDPVSCWPEGIHVDGKVVQVDICVAPVLVCKEPKRTTGAGDNISAAGLILQI